MPSFRCFLHHGGGGGGGGGDAGCMYLCTHTTGIFKAGKSAGFQTDLL